MRQVKFYRALGTEWHIRVKISRMAIEQKIDLLFAGSIGEISLHMLHFGKGDMYRVANGRSGPKSGTTSVCWNGNMDDGRAIQRRA